MLRYDDPNYGGEQMKQARADARRALADMTKTPEERVRIVIGLFPGGNLTEGPSEYLEAEQLARHLQDKTEVINCGRCFSPEKCIGYKVCRRT